MVPARGRLGACDLGGRRDGCPGDRSVRRAVPGRGRRRSPSDADGRVIHWHPDPVLVEEMFVQIARSVTGDHTTLILQDVAAPAGPVPSRPAAPPPTRRCDRDDRSPRWCRRPADRAARTGRAVSIISPTRRLRHTRSRAPSGESRSTRSATPTGGTSNLIPGQARGLTSAQAGQSSPPFEIAATSRKTRG